MYVDLSGSACICMTVMCLNEYAIKGHAVEWWVIFVWGRESCLPAVQCAANKALVWAGRRNKSSIMQDPKWHFLCCNSIVPLGWAWAEINKSQILLSGKDEQWDLNVDLAVDHWSRVALAARDENLMVWHNHSLALAVFTDPDAKSIKILSPLTPISKWKM